MIRRILTLLGVGVMALSFLPSSSGAQTEGRVELSGTGAWTVNNQFNKWKTALYYSPRSMDVSYIAKGDRDGREAFTRGDVDFAVSGLPLDADDQAVLAGRGVQVASAPISVASAALLWSGPYPSGVRTFVPDPIDPEGAGTFADYTGRLRLPTSTVAKIWTDRGFRNWDDPEFLAANAEFLPAGGIIAPILNPTAPLVRSDPSATNFYMQTLVRRFAADLFILKVADSKLEPFEVGESWPFLETGSRTGSVNTASLVAGWQNPKEGAVPTGGVITATPISEANSQKANNPKTPLFIAEMQNAAGEWVAPNSASISAAIAGGDGAPLAALDKPIPGAYPLAWVNRVYFKTSGLSIDTTNALAAMIRYSVTVGQEASMQLEEGRLSDGLVGEALAAADQLVRSNCAGDKRTVVAAADGGPFWPTGVTLPVGSFTVCLTPAAAAAAAETTTVPTTRASSPALPVVAGASAGRVSSSGVSSGGSGASPSYGTTYDDSVGVGTVDPLATAASGVTETAGGTTEPVAPQLVASALPLPMPDDGRGTLDRLSTMLLGGVLVLVARSLAGRRVPAPAGVS